MIEFRNLLPAESSAYRSIRLESLKFFPESFGADYHEASKTEKLRLESDIENQTPGRFVMGAFADDELIGICVFVEEENYSGHIYQMYVKAGFQGKNIGSHLLKAVIEESVSQFSTREIYLEVTCRNTAAYELYRKIGFKKISDQPEKKEMLIMMKYRTENTVRNIL